MFNAGYHCLVASFTEYQLEGDNRNLKISSIKEEITTTVKKSEAALLYLMTAYFDVENILMSLDGRENKFNPLGRYTKEEIKVIADALRANKEINRAEHPIRLFNFIKKSFAVLKDPEVPKEMKEDIPKLLLTAYYKEMESSQNRFIKEWGETDRTIKNICAAIEARRSGREIADVVIGDGEVVESLRNSSAADFGLKGEIDYVNSVLAITEQTDMLKKEKDLDMLRWKIIDELTIWDYFNINFILGYYMKLCMINRWLILDEKTGREMFDRIVKELTDKKQLPIN